MAVCCNLCGEFFDEDLVSDNMFHAEFEINGLKFAETDVWITGTKENTAAIEFYTETAESEVIHRILLPIRYCPGCGTELKR